MTRTTQQHMRWWLGFGSVLLLSVVIVEAACPSTACANGGICTNSSTCLCALDWLGPDCTIPSQNPLTCYYGSVVLSQTVSVQPQSQAGTWCFQYAYDTTAMHFAMYGQALGYVAFMLGAGGDGMNGGVTWVAQFTTTSTVYLHEDKGLPNFAVTALSSQSTQDLLFGIAGSLNSTTSHVQWSRMLSSTLDPSVTVFTPANLTTLATFAVNNDDRIPQSYATTIHSYAGGFRFNFATAASSASGAAPMLDDQGCAYIATIIFLTIIVGVQTSIFG